MVPRWKPNGLLRRRRPWWGGRGRRRGRTEIVAGATQVGLTLVVSRNNLWGCGYSNGILVYTLSAGRTPAGRGSHRGGRQAALEVVTALTAWYATAVAEVSPFRVRRRRRRRRTRRQYRRYRQQHWRRWRHRKFRTARLTRVVTTAVKLVGGDDVRWNSLLRLLQVGTARFTRRVTVAAHRLRPHNGIRPVSDRRI